MVMDRSEYDDKIRSMLSDPNTYKKLPRDPAPALERQMNSLLLSLKNSRSLPRSVYERLRSSAGKTPLLYGLPKIHKPDTPLRPIVSFIHSPTYQLSKHLVSILSPLVGRSLSNVTNSSDFADFICRQTLPLNTLLVSFDVTSLFTNVPVDLAVKIAGDRLTNDPSLADRSSLSPTEIQTLLSFCLNATYLAYRGEFFQQTFGTAMGSPVSVTVADLVMEDVEQRALSTYHSPPPFWKRYVDDTCTALPADQIQCFHDHLNSVEPTIQFTFETESEGKLSFLDTQITHHPDGDLSTTVYRKATHTDKYLDFQSHHPLAHKAAVVRTLFSRADNICSSLLEKGTEEEHVTRALKSNGYPAQFIRSQSKPTRRPDTVNRPKATVVLPYVRHISETIRRILTPLEIRSCFKPHQTLRQLLVHPKDPIPPMQRPGVVNQVPCASCPEVYVGQTGRTLEHRLKEHKRALTSGTTISAIAEHALNTNHDIDSAGQMHWLLTVTRAFTQDVPWKLGTSDHKNTP